MRCPICNCTESHVVDTRSTDEGFVIRRRRECANCHRRFTTYEKIETTPLMVIKKDGRREPFDPEKIRRGVMRACEKRPIAMAGLDRLVADIEVAVTNTLEAEITSRRIGEAVIKHLRELDEVAYVRFAAVYRSFHDISSFLSEITALLTDEER